MYYFKENVKHKLQVYKSDKSGDTIYFEKYLFFLNLCFTKLFTTVFSEIMTSLMINKYSIQVQLSGPFLLH